MTCSLCTESSVESTKIQVKPEPVFPSALFVATAIRFPASLKKIDGKQKSFYDGLCSKAGLRNSPTSVICSGVCCSEIRSAATHPLRGTIRCCHLVILLSEACALSEVEKYVDYTHPQNEAGRDEKNHIRHTKAEAKRP